MFLNRITYILLWGLLTAILVVACNTANDVKSSISPNEDCRVVQHTMGESCIPRNPQRVIAIKPNHFANSVALGIKPIASAFYEGFPVWDVLQNEVGEIESIGDLNTPNIEKILLLEPDLILSNSNLDSIYPQLSQIAPTVVLDARFPPPPYWREEFQEMAQILDKQETYQQLMADYWQQIAKLKQAFGDRYQNAEISFGGIAAGAGIWVYGAKHPVGEIFQDLGLQRPSVQRDDFYFLENISEEKLSYIDGDILFLTTWGRDEDIKEREKLIQKPLWQKLNAVREERVYFVNPYWVNPGNFLSINAILGDLERYLLDSSSSS
ncbi:MAG: iron-siderophore ABC transporter substrate-binding protein [Cyanobacteria bacterium P01_F01_bin.143]